MSVTGLSAVLSTLTVLTLTGYLIWYPVIGSRVTCQYLCTPNGLHYHTTTGLSATSASYNILSDNNFAKSNELSLWYIKPYWCLTNNTCTIMNMVPNASRRSSRNLPRLNYVNMSVRVDNISNSTEGDNLYRNSENVSIQNGTELNSPYNPDGNMGTVLIQRQNGTEENSPTYSNIDREIMPSQSQNGTENNSPNLPGYEVQHRDYTLNLDKVMKKKLIACSADCKVESELKGGNYIFVFSAAMYEFYRNALVEHFEFLEQSHRSNIKVIYKDSEDKSGAIVETLMKIYPKSGKKLKYAINLYHTMSKLMVNGSEAHKFNLEHGKITDSILHSQDVVSLDREMKDVIEEGLRSLVIEKQPSRSTRSATNLRQIEQTSDQQQSQGGTDPSVIDNRVLIPNDESIVDLSPCPGCAEPVDFGSDGIFCDHCENWYHLHCESLSVAEGRALEHSDDPYYCLACNSDSPSQQLEELTLLTGDRNAQESDPTLTNTIESSDTSASQCTTNKQIFVQTLPKHVDMQTDQTCLKLTSQSPNQTNLKQKYKPSVQPRPELTTSVRNQTQTKHDSLPNQLPTCTGSIRVNIEPSHENRSKVDGSPVAPVNGEQSHHRVSIKDQAALPGGKSGTTKNGSKTGKGVKKVKENEQEEELKLARSLLNNYERKITELQNSVRILRRETLVGSLDRHSNLVPENINNMDSSHNTHSPSSGSNSHTTVPSQPAMQQEITALKESIRIIELDQLKSRVSAIENQIMSQMRTASVPISNGGYNFPYNIPYGGHPIYNLPINQIPHPQISAFGSSFSYRDPGVPQYLSHSFAHGHHPIRLHPSHATMYTISLLKITQLLMVYHLYPIKYLMYLTTVFTPIYKYILRDKIE